jgi:GNAT superfamily N-acetyltransferase
MSIYLSELDYQRFGYKTAQARLNSADEQSQLSQFCVDNAVELSIVRVPSSELSLLQNLEDEGYRMMDCLVYYAFKFDKKAVPSERKYHTRPVLPEELDEVVTIAQESFKGYMGHYHADPRLPKEKCDEVYVDWAANSVKSREVAHEVLVVAALGHLDAFATLRMNNPQEGEGVLFGVAPHAQGLGIYQSMMIGAMQWVHGKGANQMVVSTQITNIAVQKVWARLGFEMDRAYYTLHKWF